MALTRFFARDAELEKIAALVAEQNGRRLEMQLIFSSQPFVGVDVVPMIVEAARAVGINLVTKAYDPSELFSMRGPLNQGSFHVALLNYRNGIEPDPSDFVSCSQRAPNGFKLGAVLQRECRPCRAAGYIRIRSRRSPMHLRLHSAAVAFGHPLRFLVAEQRD